MQGQLPYRAAPPRPPAPTAESLRRRAERERRVAERTRLEHRSLLRGMLWLVFAALLVSLARAGLERAFVPGWWQQW